MSAADDLRRLGGPTQEQEDVARFIDGLSIGEKAKARFFSEYLRETKQVISRASLIAARDWSFYL